MIDEAVLHRWMARLAQDDEREEQHARDVAELHEARALGAEGLNLGTQQSCM